MHRALNVLICTPLCMSQENVPQVRSFKPGSISAAELRSLADSLRRQSPAAAYRHAALLQLAEAAAAALEGSHAGDPGMVVLGLRVTGLEHASLLA